MIPSTRKLAPLLSNHFKVRLVRRKVPINCTVTYIKEDLAEVKQQTLMCRTKYEEGTIL